MYRDKSLLPAQAVRLCVLGTLARRPQRYGDLAASSRRFMGALIGPMQVLGRVLEFVFLGQVRPSRLGTLTLWLLPASLAVLLLWQVPLGWRIGLLAVGAMALVLGLGWLRAQAWLQSWAERRTWHRRLAQLLLSLAGADKHSWVGWLCCAGNWLVKIGVLALAHVVAVFLFWGWR